MIEFSQYNVQIYCSTIACLLSIIIAIFPSQIKLTRKVKAFFSLSPLIINLITSIIIIIDVYLSSGWMDKGIDQFIEGTDIVSFCSHLLSTSVVASIIMFFVIIFLKRTSYNDKQLMRYYLKLTSDQNDSGHITIIGGSMDFFGIRPCKKISSSFKCDKVYHRTYRLLKAFERWFSEKQCRKCCLNNEQWKQLSSLINKGCRLQIVCTHPDNTEFEIYTKELLGFILKTWKKGNNIEIKFFTADNDPHIRGRIIEDFSNIQHVCWNFKTNNDKNNSYEEPYIFSKNERMGAFVIKAFDDIRSSAIAMSTEEEQEYIKAFEDRK